MERLQLEKFLSRLGPIIPALHAWIGNSAANSCVPGLYQVIVMTKNT